MLRLNELSAVVLSTELWTVLLKYRKIKASFDPSQNEKPQPISAKICRIDCVHDFTQKGIESRPPIWVKYTTIPRGNRILH